MSEYIVDVLLAPDILAVQEVEDSLSLDGLAAAIQVIDPSVIYTAYLKEGNDVGGIDVGYLIQESVIEVVGDSVTQLGAEELYDFKGLVEPLPLHDRPPPLLHARLPGAPVSPAEFSVLNVHMRSMNKIEQHEDSARVRYKRLEQTKSLANMVQTLQTSGSHQNLVVIGDLNAFQFTDGYVDVMGHVTGTETPGQSMYSAPSPVDPPLVNLTNTISESERYSYVYHETANAQAIDHALTTIYLEPFVNDFQHGRGNADAMEVEIDDSETPLASSDHDGLVVYVDVQGLLPIELAALTAKTEGRDAVLEWTTESETNNAGFAIDHQGPGAVSFEEIAFVDSKTSHLPHSSTPLLNYTHTVKDLSPGSHSFRLRSIDLDGTEHVNGVIEVTIDMMERFFVEGVYPNPMNPAATMVFAVRDPQDVSIILYDAMGRKVKTVLDGYVEGGSMQRHRIDASDLSSGVYMLRLQGKDFQDVRPVMVVR